jgi:hypothetical protein
MGLYKNKNGANFRPRRHGKNFCLAFRFRRLRGVLGLHEVREMDGAFAFDNRAIGMLLALARMALDHVQAFNDGPFFLRIHGDDFAALALFFAGQHNDFVAFLNVRFHKILR